MPRDLNSKHSKETKSTKSTKSGRSRRTSRGDKRTKDDRLPPPFPRQRRVPNDIEVRQSVQDMKNIYDDDEGLVQSFSSNSGSRLSMSHSEHENVVDMSNYYGDYPTGDPVPSDPHTRIECQLAQPQESDIFEDVETAKSVRKSARAEAQIGSESLFDQKQSKRCGKKRCLLIVLLILLLGAAGTVAALLLSKGESNEEPMGVDRDASADGNGEEPSTQTQGPTSSGPDSPRPGTTGNPTAAATTAPISTSNPTSVPSTVPSMVPSAAPSQAPSQDPLEFFRSLFIPISGAALYNESTPQFNALSWLVDNIDAIGTMAVDTAQTRYILATLYYATDGDIWDERYGFLSQSHHCQWNDPVVEGGVFCNAQQQIRFMNLGDNNLRGTLPLELYFLETLQRIELGHNDIEGTIPPDVARLTNVRSFSFESTSIEGKLPTELGRLSVLETLTISDNRIQGEIPSEFGSLPILQVLDLKQSNLNGTIPQELGNLSRLEFLDLSMNSLDGPIPDSLGNSTSLEILVLEHNELEGQIPSQIGLLTKLETLKLGNNRLENSLPSELGQLQELETAEFHQNFLSGPVPETIGDLPELETLTLQSNLFSGTIPPVFCDRLDTINKLWADCASQANPRLACDCCVCFNN